ncbi:hypothetical protein R1sor_004501 [Riccia sorocarpa]|uniref:Uncharacterized protein n=1 Tax=Riccia sorocarpa TaxID=122646 RepID=A0ABD3HKN1_9MARC
MEESAHLSFKDTEDFEFIPCVDGKVKVDVSFFKARWDLGPKSIYISERTVSNGEVLNYIVNRSAEQQWTLVAGKRYIVRGVVDSLHSHALRSTVSSPESPMVSSLHNSTIEDFGSSSAPLLSWVGIPNGPTVISSFRALRQLRGRSELSRLELPDFAHQLVVQLPDKYNGNVIFELPLKKPEEILKKGAILEGMDRTHDCWSWTKQTTTSAVIGLKRQGSPQAFRDAMNEAISNTPLLANIPISLNGDIRTTTVKRKSPYGTGITQNDTHRHDKVAKTQQAMKFVRGRLHFGPELDDPTYCGAAPKKATPAGTSETIDPTCTATPANVPEQMITKTADTAGTSNGYAIPSNVPEPTTTKTAEPAGTSNGNTTRSNVSEQTTSRTAEPAGTSNGNATPTTVPEPSRTVALNGNATPLTVPETTTAKAATHAAVSGLNVQPPSTSTLPAEVAGPSRRPDASLSDMHRAREQTLPDTDILPSSSTQPTDSAVVLISSDESSDVEIVQIAPRRRPPTRGSPVTQNLPYIRHTGPSQYGIPIVEVHADVRQWHICRTSNNGASPACFAATPGRSAPRALCKTKLRVAGYNRMGVGVVAPSFIGKLVYMTVERDYRFWFCPNGICHRGPGDRQCKTQMSPVPNVIPVQIGTGLTQDEVDFITAKGFVLVRRTQVHMSEALPDESEIKVLVDAYPEKVHDFPRDHRFKSRGGRKFRQKQTMPRICQMRLERARSDQMKMVFSWTITSGNGYGKLFRIASGPDFSRLYIVHICCFPSCSCKDF